MYGLLTKCEVKMAGYWPSSFFVCLWTVTKSRTINSQKRTRPISSHLERTNLVNKGFIIWLLGKFCWWDTAGSPERARWLYLARWGSQSHHTIWFILPAHGASHIITWLHTLLPGEGVLSEFGGHTPSRICLLPNVPSYKSKVKEELQS